MEKLMEARLAAFKDLRLEIQNRLSHQYTFINFSLVSLSLFLTAAAINMKNPEIVTVALGCFGPITIAVFGALLNMEISFISRAANRVAELEREMNNDLPTPVFTWDSEIIPKNYGQLRQHIFATIGYSLFIILLGAGAWFYLIFADRDLFKLTPGSYYAIMGCGVGLAGVIITTVFFATKPRRPKPKKP